MTNSTHPNMMGVAAFTVLMLVLAASCSQKRAPVREQAANPITREQIARTYGLDSFGQIEAIRYTWNAQFPGVNVSRSWIWEPRTNKVSYEGKDKDGKPVKVTYLRSEDRKSVV